MNIKWYELPVVIEGVYGFDDSWVNKGIVSRIFYFSTFFYFFLHKFTNFILTNLYNIDKMNFAALICKLL